MSTELKPCLFCGKKEPEVLNDVGECRRLFSVMCDCGVETDFHHDAEGAVLQWNTRTESTELEQLRKERDELKSSNKDLQDFVSTFLSIANGETECGFDAIDLEEVVKLNKHSNENDYEQTTIIDCHECDAAFYTSANKNIGEKFNCPSCHHPLKAEDDYGEDGELIWYAITDREVLREGEDHV